MFEILPWKRKSKTNGNELPREIDYLYDRYFHPNFLSSSQRWGEGKWNLNLDISEGRKDIIVKVEIPGVEAKDLDVSIDGRLLKIKGEKKQEQKEEGETYYRVESSYGFFNRTIELPAEVEPNKVDANYKRGVLKIKLRKAKEDKTKRIKVLTG